VFNDIKTKLSNVSKQKNIQKITRCNKS